MFLEIDPVEISSWVSRYLWPFFRVAGFLTAMPLFGTRLVPQRIRLLFAFVISILVTPLLPDLPKTDALSVETIIISAQQFLIGFAVGFLFESLVQVFILAGQMIAMQTGLGMAMSADPASGVNVAVVSQWFLVLVALLFLTLNGHLVAIEILVDSFYTIPVGFTGLSSNGLWEIVQWAKWMFASAVVLAIPAIIALLIVNIIFGVMTRAAPQLNIFAIGFPFTMIMGLLVLWLSINSFADKYRGYLNQLYDFIRSVIGP